MSIVEQIVDSGAFSALITYDQQMTLFENFVSNLSFITFVLVLASAYLTIITANMKNRDASLPGRLFKLKFKHPFEFFILLSLTVFPIYIIYMQLSMGDTPFMSRETARKLAGNYLYVSFVCLVFGGVVYSIRCRLRKTYGVVEALIGVIVTYQSSKFADIYGALPFAAGLYIIVRGIDNVEKGLSKDGWPRQAWQYVFGKP